MSAIFYSPGTTVLILFNIELGVLFVVTFKMAKFLLAWGSHQIIL